MGSLNTYPAEEEACSHNDILCSQQMNTHL